MRLICGSGRCRPRIIRGPDGWFCVVPIVLHQLFVMSHLALVFGFPVLEW